jgi:hypothetical protein
LKSYLQDYEDESNGGLNMKKRIGALILVSSLITGCATGRQVRRSPGVTEFVNYTHASAHAEDASNSSIFRSIVRNFNSKPGSFDESLAEWRRNNPGLLSSDSGTALVFLFEKCKYLNEKSIEFAVNELGMNRNYLIHPEQEKIDQAAKQQRNYDQDINDAQQREKDRENRIPRQLEAIQKCKDEIAQWGSQDPVNTPDCYKIH